ncbi:MAG TPA: tripartite tricarboxylate transporter substrate binding protein [Roseomonas sp.]
MSEHASSRRRLLATFATAGAAGLARPALAQRRGAWPERSIELAVGFSAGGGTDLTARTYARFLEQVLGGSMVVVNRAGASGEIALGLVGRARPDGYQLAMTNMPGLVTLPIERRNSQFKLDDFDYVANLVTDPSAFSVAADSPITSIAQLVERAKQAPDTLTYGSTGIGTDDHLALVLFQAAAGVRLVHVPFPGAGPLRTAMLGKQIDIAGLNVGEVASTPDGLRMLVQGGATRSPFAATVPTFREAGFAIEMGSERGIVAPKNLPAEVIARLREATAQVARDPAFIEQVRIQFTELNYIDGPAWRARLTEGDRSFRELWQRQPWSET